MPNKNRYKKMTRICLFLGFILSLTGLVNALTLVVNIDETNEGYITYIDYSEEVSNSFQKISVDWQNSGSVNCHIQMRTSIIKDGQIIYTAWSDMKKMYAGSYDVFDMYYYDHNISGDFMADLKIYVCDEIFDGPKINFTIAENSIKNLTGKIANSRQLIETSVRSDDKKIAIDITPTQDIDRLLIFPKDIRPGWRIAAKEINDLKAGETRTVTIEYKKGIEDEARLQFLLASPEEYIYSPITVDIKKSVPKKSIYYYLFILSFIINLVIFKILQKTYRNKRKSKNK